MRSNSKLMLPLSLVLAGCLMSAGSASAQEIFFDIAIRSITCPGAEAGLEANLCKVEVENMGTLPVEANTFEVLIKLQDQQPSGLICGSAPLQDVVGVARSRVDLLPRSTIDVDVDVSFPQAGDIDVIGRVGLGDAYATTSEDGSDDDNTLWTSIPVNLPAPFFCSVEPAGQDPATGRDLVIIHGNFFQRYGPNELPPTVSFNGIEGEVVDIRSPLEMTVLMPNMGCSWGPIDVTIDNTAGSTSFNLPGALRPLLVLMDAASHCTPYRFSVQDLPAACAITGVTFDGVDLTGQINPPDVTIQVPIDATTGDHELVVQTTGEDVPGRLGVSTPAPQLVLDRPCFQCGTYSFEISDMPAQCPIRGLRLGNRNLNPTVDGSRVTVDMPGDIPNGTYDLTVQTDAGDMRERVVLDNPVEITSITPPGPYCDTPVEILLKGHAYQASCPPQVRLGSGEVLTVDRVETYPAQLAAGTKGVDDVLSSLVNVAYETKLFATIPSGSARREVLSVETPFGRDSKEIFIGCEARAPIVTTVTECLSCSQYVRLADSESGDAIVRAAGENLKAITSVQIGGKDVRFEAASDQDLGVAVPKGMTGALDVTFIGPAGAVTQTVQISAQRKL